MAYTLDSTVGELLKDAHAVEMLEQYVPGASTNPTLAANPFSWHRVPGTWSLTTCPGIGQSAVLGVNGSPARSVQHCVRQSANSEVHRFIIEFSLRKRIPSY